MAEDNIDAMYDDAMSEIDHTEGSADVSDDAALNAEVDEFYNELAEKEESNNDELFVDDEELEELEEEPSEVEEMPLVRPQEVPVGVENGVKIYDRDGKEVILPEDAEIEVKIDGEIHRVKLSDYRNDISGQKAISQRFSVLDAERKAVAERKQAMDAAETHVKGLMANGRVVEAMDFIFESIGMNNQEVVGKFFEQISEPLQKYMQLTPDQKREWALRAQAERTKIELEKTKNQAAQLQAQQAQLIEVRRVQSELGIDDATFAQRYHELQQEMEAGYIQAQPVTAELVGHYALLRERQDWAIEALSKVKPDLAKDYNTVDDILRVVIRKYDQAGVPFTKDDMHKIIESAYGLPSQKPKAEAVKQALQKKGNPAAQKMVQNQVSKQKPKNTQTKKPFLDVLKNASPKQLNKMIDKWAQ